MKRKRQNTTEISGVLTFDECEKSIRAKCLWYCFKAHFERDYYHKTNKDRLKFKEDFSFFVKDLNRATFEKEYACYLFNLWLERLGLNYSRTEIEDFLIEQFD